MLRQFLESSLVVDTIINSVVFEQDGNPCHCTTLIQDYLYQWFPNWWIECERSQKVWSPVFKPPPPLPSFQRYCLGIYQIASPTKQGLWYWIIHVTMTYCSYSWMGFEIKCWMIRRSKAIIGNMTHDNSIRITNLLFKN